MTPTEKLRKIMDRFPECSPKLTEFPSGEVMLDITLRGVSFAAVYLPEFNAFGLSKVEGSSPFWEGVDESFTSGEELEMKIVEMMNSEK